MKDSLTYLEHMFSSKDDNSAVTEGKVNRLVSSTIELVSLSKEAHFDDSQIKNMLLLY